jgi:predicted nucleic acid-binding Zn ribbon protein
LSDYAQSFYHLMLKSVAGKVSYDQKKLDKRPKNNSQPFDPNRDPIKLSNSLDEVIGQYNWGNQLAQAELFVSWQDIVGSNVASACRPNNIERETLHVNCSSTAWATQMRLMSRQVLSEINLRYPDLAIAEIKFHGPQAPSWNRGPRSVPGRGPRDTYG